MDESAVYRIKVQGELESAWADRMSSMAISIDRSDDTGPVTTLEGWLADQAALSGVLETLYELHLPVFSVERLDGQES